MYTKKGFTLIELLVVVLIIGILAAIALPMYNKAVERSRAAEGITLVHQIARANELFRLEYGDYTDDILELEINFGGTDSVVGNRNSKETSNFSCRSAANGNDLCIAVCRRKNKSAGFEILKSTGPEVIYCFADNENGKEWCKQVTGKEVAGSSGAVRF